MMRTTAMAMIVLAVVLAAFAPTAAAADPSYVYGKLYVNTGVGYANSSSGDFTNPGPEFALMDNQTLQIDLYASDNNTHYFYIDMDGDGKPSGSDWTSGRSFDKYDPWYVGVSFGSTGTYIYRDMWLDYYSGMWRDGGISGKIVVTAAPPPPPPPKPWWVWDPFWIFGLLVEIGLVFYVTYTLSLGVRWYHARRKVKATHPETIRWLKAIMDPDGPTRPTEQYVRNIKIEKKKRKKAKDSEFSKNRDPPRPPSGPPGGGGLA